MLSVDAGTYKNCTESMSRAIVEYDKELFIAHLEFNVTSGVLLHLETTTFTTVIIILETTGKCSV